MLLSALATHIKLPIVVFSSEYRMEFFDQDFRPEDHKVQRSIILSPIYFFRCPNGVFHHIVHKSELRQLRHLKEFCGAKIKKFEAKDPAINMNIDGVVQSDDSDDSSVESVKDLKIKEIKQTRKKQFQLRQ